jgi:hypothetical protein
MTTYTSYTSTGYPVDTRLARLLREERRARRLARRRTARR